MIDYYDRDGSPLTTDEWTKMLGIAAKKRVAETTLPDGTWISTVWLGLNHQYGDGPPTHLRDQGVPGQNWPAQRAGLRALLDRSRGHCGARSDGEEMGEAMSSMEIATRDEQALEIIDLSLSRAPEAVLEEARRAARALKDVIEAKPKKVEFNGEQYLEYEDWQTVGRFYGISPRIPESGTRYVEYGGAQGWEAFAEAVHVASGRVVSSASAMCLNDEEKWSSRSKYEWQYVKRTGGYSTEDPGRDELIWERQPDGKNRPKKERRLVGEVNVPQFQLRSMAQTRAGAKALRNALAWVVVLAGYKPTPAEEMDGLDKGGDALSRMDQVARNASTLHASTESNAAPVADGVAGATPDPTARFAHDDPRAHRTDPEDHRAESEVLLPLPDAERDPFINRIRKFTDAKVTVIRRRIGLGDEGYHGLEKLTPAQLDTLARHLEASK